VQGQRKHSLSHSAELQIRPGDGALTTALESRHSRVHVDVVRGEVEGNEEHEQQSPLRVLGGKEAHQARGGAPSE
jgi:hypothetical protein